MGIARHLAAVVREDRWRLAGDRGRPLALALTPGNVADISMAIPLLSVATPARRLIADRADDADTLRRWLADRLVGAVIPSTAAHRTPYPLDRRVYRRRNVIERLFCRFKNWRRIATRYDRHASNYLPPSRSLPPSPSDSNESSCNLWLLPRAG